MANLREQADMSEGIPAPDEPDRKCTKCGELKPATEFHRQGNRGRRKICAECRSANRGPEFRARNKSTDEKRRDRLARYGITLAQYEQMAEAQGRVCAICGRPPYKRASLSVDHCHQSGRVRALLCDGCNRWLGIYERFREGVGKYDEFLLKYGDGNPLLGYDLA